MNIKYCRQWIEEAYRSLDLGGYRPGIGSVIVVASAVDRLGEELVFFDVVLGDGNQAKAEFHVGIVGVANLAFAENPLVSFVPELQIGGAELLDVVGQIDEDGFDADRNGGFAIFVQIAGIAEIELFNRGCSIQAIRPKHEIECFADRALSDVVAADQERMPREVKFRLLDAAEVLYLQSRNTHGSPK